MLNVSDFHAARRFADTRFGRIPYVERGAGDTALFVHGLPLNGFHWHGVIDRLVEHRRCLALDLMGLGYSDVPESQDFAPTAQAAMIAAFLDALSIDTVDRLANDRGGGIAQLVLAEHPRRVRSLLLTNCDVHTINPAGDHYEQQIGRRVDRDIVQIGIRPDGTTTRLTFAEISDNSFHWIGEALNPDGRTWKLEGDFRATRLSARRSS